MLDDLFTWDDPENAAKDFFSGSPVIPGAALGGLVAYILSQGSKNIDPRYAVPAGMLGGGLAGYGVGKYSALQVNATNLLK